MEKEIEDLIKLLNNGKIYGINSKLAKKLQVSDVAVRNWFSGIAKPSKENICKLAKLIGKKEDDVKKIFELNYNSKNSNSFNNYTMEEIKNYKERIKLLEEKISFLEEKIKFYKERK